ncbi:MAG: putative sensor with domain [Eubacterium sp.]|nr:putative sensor with domain [Eubacterium sp.]
MRFNIKLHVKMIISYSFLAILIIVSLYCFIGFYIFNMLEEKITDNTLQLSIKISQQIDAYINEVSQITKTFIVNKDIQDTLNDINNSEFPIDANSNLVYGRRFDNIMNRIIPITSIPLSHIYIYNNDNQYKYSYNSIGSNFELISGNEGIMQLIKNRQMKLVCNNINSPFYTGTSSFSLIRPVYDINGIMYGYVEVQQNYSELSSICNIGNTGQVYIVDNTGTFLYPTSEVPQNIRDFVLNSLSSRQKGILKDVNGDMYSCSNAGRFDLNVYVRQPAKTVLAPLNLVRNITFVVIIFLTLFALFMVYFISRLLVNPIRRLRDDIMNIGLNNMTLNTSTKIYHDEVHQLNTAFQDMLIRLKESMEREVASGKEEAKARFAALQAQIAPHFIHNVLYIISISAQEKRPSDVVIMCKQLSNMLRYVVNPPSTEVMLEDEIEYTRNYLELQAKNYEGSLGYTVDIPEDAGHIVLPRLVIQPFVENSFIHGFKNISPPWKIRISADILDKEWRIIISDNGCGMSQEEMKELNQKLMNIQSSDIFANPKKSANGMGNLGILNTVMRLKLMYNTDLKFSISSNLDRGTIVSISGPYMAQNTDT